MVLSAVTNAATFIEGIASIVGSTIIAIFKLIILLIFFSIQIILALIIVTAFIYIQNNYVQIINNIIYSTNPLETSIFEVTIAAYNIFAITMNILIALGNILIQVYDFLLPLVEAIIGILIQALIQFLQYITGTSSIACWISDLLYMFTGISLAVEIGLRAMLYAITVQFEIDQTAFLGPKEQIQYIEQDIDFQGFKKHSRANMNFDDQTTMKILKFGRRLSQYSGIDVSDIMDALLIKAPGTPRNQPVFDNTNFYGIHPDEDLYAVYESDIKPTFSRAPCCEPVGSEHTCLIGEIDETLTQQCPPDSIMLNIVTPAIQVIIVDLFIILAALAPILVVLIEAVIVELLVLIPAILDAIAKVVYILTKSGAVQQFFALIFHALFGIVRLVKAFCPLIALILYTICSITRFFTNLFIADIVGDFIPWNPPTNCHTQYVTSDAPFLSRTLAKTDTHVAKTTPRLYSDSVLVPNSAVKQMKTRNYHKEVLFNDIMIKNPARGSEKQYLDLTRHSRNAIDDITRTEYLLSPTKHHMHERTIVTKNFTDTIRDPVHYSAIKRQKRHNIVQRDMGTYVATFTGCSTINHCQRERHRNLLELKHNLAASVSSRHNHIKLPFFLVMSGAAHIAFNTDFNFELVGQNTRANTKSVRTFFTQYHIFDNHPIHLLSMPTSRVHAFALAINNNTPPDDLPFDIDIAKDVEGNVENITMVMNTPYYSDNVDLVCDITVTAPPKWCMADFICNDLNGVIQIIGNLFKDIGGDSQTADACQCYDKAGTGCQGIQLETIYQNCDGFQEMCQGILSSNIEYDHTSPSFNQTACLLDTCANACGLCDGLFCNADPNYGFNCSICVSDVPCMSSNGVNAQNVLGSEHNTNGTRPSNSSCSATDESYDTQPGDPCYTCLGDTIVPFSTNQGCTTCGGAQQSVGDVSSQPVRCKSIFNMCKCTNSNTKVGAGTQTVVPCDPDSDPNCTDVSPGDTGCTSSIDGDGAESVCSTTTTPVTIESFVNCEAKAIVNFYSEQVIIRNDTTILLRTLLSDLPSILEVLMKAGDAIFLSGVFFIDNIINGTAQYMHALKNTQYLSTSIKDSIKYFKEQSAAYKEYESVFGKRDAIFKNISLSDFSTEPGKYGTYKNLLKTPDCYGGSDTESTTYRACPYYPCCSSSPVGSNLCYPPLNGVRPFNVVNYTQELIDEFYCNLEKLNSLREDQVSSNVEEAQKVVRKEGSPWPTQILGNKKYKIILNMLQKRNFTNLFNIEDKLMPQTYFRSLDVLRETIDPLGQSQILSEGDDSFAGFYDSHLRKEDRSFMAHKSMGNNIKKIILNTINIFEDYAPVFGMDRTEKYYGRRMFERTCTGGDCGSFVGADGEIKQQPQNDEPKGICKKARDCPCTNINGECYPSKTDPYCCCQDDLSDPYQCCKGMILCIPTIPENWRFPIINAGDLAWTAVLTDPETCAYVDTWYKYILFLIRAVTNWVVKGYLERLAVFDSPTTNIDNAHEGLTNIFLNGPKNAVARFQYFFLKWLMFPDGVWPSFSFICAILNIGQFLLFLFALFIFALIWFAFSDVRERIFDFVVNTQQQIEMSVIASRG